MLIRSLSYTLTFALVVAASALPLATHASTVGASLTGSTDVRAVLQDATVPSPGTDASITTHASVSAQQEVDASTTAGADDTTILMTREDLQSTSTAPAEEDGTLAAHVRSRLADDARIDSVMLSSKQVSLTYRVPTKLFGFINVQTPLQVTVSADGTTSVTYPWYGFLLTGNQAGLTLRAQAAAQSVIASPSVSGTISAQTQATLFDSLTTALEAAGDTKH